LATRAPTGGILQRAAAADTLEEAPPEVHEVLRAPGAPLDADTRNAMEDRLGADLSDVRVHTDDRAAASARAARANAYTVGRSIVFDHGRYAPNSAGGRALLGHELVHTIQQGGGPPPASGQPLQIDAVDSASEGQAQAIGTAVTRPGSARPTHEPLPTPSPHRLARDPVPGQEPTLEDLVEARDRRARTANIDEGAPTPAPS
jgi:hypothetical protein